MSGFTHLDPIVQVSIVGGAFSVVCAVIGLFGLILPRLHRNTATLDGVKEQVANSHGTNLRDDLDFIRDLILDVRTDIAWVRRDHIDLSHRVAILEGEAA